MKTLYNLPIIACLLLGITACNKVSLKSLKNHSLTDTTTNVYIAGYVNEKGNQSAAYWKNGQLVMLGDTTAFTLAKGIAVVGTDVYVAGTLYPGPTNPNVVEQAIYWKNGVQVALSPDSTGSEADCIAVSGTDVYIAGYIHHNYNSLQTNNGTQTLNAAVYWKNGVPATLQGALSISSIFVSGSDVYFAGSINGPNNVSTAAYWKNGGSPISLAYPQPDLVFNASFATSIATAGSNVYVTGGTSSYPPETWINGSASFMPAAKVYNSTAGIATDGTNVYVVGSALFNGIDQSAAIWKNNTGAPLPLGSGASGANSMAYAVTVNGGNVYAVGAVYPNGGATSTALYWKNGAVVALTNGSTLGATATAITVTNY